MKNISGGYIINSTFHQTQIDEEKVNFDINIDNHCIHIDFNEELIKIDNINCLFLKDSNGNEVTLLDCRIREYSIYKVDILFATILTGVHVGQLDALKPTKVLFEIDSEPVPLLNIHLPKGKVVLDGVDLEIQSNKNSLTNVDLIIVPIDTKLSINHMEDIFFKLLDIFFLYLGFYPYIETERIICNNNNVYIHHLQFSQYKKGISKAYWSTIISSHSSISLEKVYPTFKSMIDKNGIIIKVLVNAIHSSDLIIDLTLSILIQCVEGYMKEWHKRKKFSDSLKNIIKEKLILSLDTIELNNEENATENQPNKDEIISSIQGLLGKINSPSLVECLEDAFNMNDCTKMILKQQIKNNEYKDFINKSKATRNQFSHMSLQKKKFQNIYEIIMAKEKYILLLRLLMLNDLGIQVNGNLKRYIDDIDNEFLRNRYRQ